MKLKTLKELAYDDINLIDRFIILGPSGIGKSEIIKSIARSHANKIGKKFIDLNEYVSEEILHNPDKYFVYYRIIGPYFNYDLIEYPKVDADKVKVIPNLTFLILQTCQGLLFVDEITNVSLPHVRTQLYALLDSKEIGSHIKLQNIVIIAAGNRMEHSEDAEGLPKPLRNRLCVLNVHPDFETWIEWYKNSEFYNPYISAFLYEKPELLYTEIDDDDGYRNFASPRTWTRLSSTLNKLGNKIPTDIVIGYVGPKIADMFVTYLKYNVDFARLKEDVGYWEKLNRSQKVIAAMYIATKVDKDYQPLLEYVAKREPEFVKLVIATANEKSDIQVLTYISRLISE